MLYEYVLISLQANKSTWKATQMQSKALLLRFRKKERQREDAGNTVDKVRVQFYF